MEKITNEYLTLQVSERGAELVSIKDENGKEYLWQADPKGWNRHSPILFPFVGGLWNNTFRVEGKEYEAKRHGFARDAKFKLITHTPNRLAYSLHSSTETYKQYPFHFILAVSYKLEGNRIHVVWHVQNTDNKEIHFQIGGHPAFLLPDMKEGEPMRGFLKLSAETLVRSQTNNGHLTTAYQPFETDETIVEFTEETFKDDALIFEHAQLNEVQLLNKKGEAEVTVNFNTPALGLWSPYGKNAPFVCIEPWYGVADVENYEGELKDRRLMNHLHPGASFMAEYVITIR